MLPKSFTRFARVVAGALMGVLLVAPNARAQANAVISGRVTGEAGQPLEFANVYITELVISVPTNAQGQFTITVPAARVSGQSVNLRVRAVGYKPTFQAVTLTPGNQSKNFTLERDVNRLSEVVVSGSIEGTERSKVAFAVGRVTAEDIPVPALNPVTALQGKVAGMRIAQTGGRPGSSPEILLRGPTSLNASGRSTGPLIIVDGTILRNQSLNEIGGLDIESVEVVKGAAGASLYGAQAANGVIMIKTKRGASRNEVRVGARSEYGISDLNSLRFGAPVNHHLQLDETGKRFCIAGSGATSPCSRSTGWMEEILRINNVNADTIRTPQSMQWNSPAASGGELLNVYQSNIWPGQYYDGFAQASTQNPVMINSVDVNGRVGNVRYFVTGNYTDDGGAVKGLDGSQQRRARVNLDYDVRPNLTISVSSLFNKSRTDNRSGGSSNGGIFGQLLRGAPAGTDYLARDTLGRALVRGGGAGLRGTGNGAGTFLYDMETLNAYNTTNRFQGSINATYTPAAWASFEALYSYDNRTTLTNSYVQKGYRTFTANPNTNLGNQQVSNGDRESMNAYISATFRKQLLSDLNGKVNFRGLFDKDYNFNNNTSGQQFVVKDVYTLSNTTTNFTTGSSSQLIKNVGFIAGTNFDYKGKYILDGTFRTDGSSLFGEGNRFASFGRVSGVWRLSEESWFSLPKVSDLRVRASNGSAGNSPGFTAQYETYSCSASGCSLGQAGNSQLKPETTRESEFGTDFTLFGRFGVEFTYAQSNTTNQILNVPTPSSLGFSSKWQNAGTVQNKTFEVALNMPIVTGRDFQWNARGTWDRNRTYITELFMPEYFTSGGTGQGTGSMFLYTARTDKQDGAVVNRFGNIWGRKFYKSCSDLPASVQSQCGAGKAYQVDDKGWVVWTGEGNSYTDGITKNLWQTKLPAAQSPWNYPLNFGHPIVDRPLKGEKGEGVGANHIIGNTLPSFRFALNNTITYKKLSLYALVDGTIGHYIQNQGEGWGLLDFASGYFDMGSRTVATAKPLGYGWRVGGPEGAGTGGFYDLLNPNNYNTESGSYAKIREMALTYQLGKVGAINDVTLQLIGRNIFTFTKYSGYDPELGVSGGQGGSGLINQVDAFDFPTLRTYTFTISTRF
ncbi:MAG: SusC/RagA family TonB-linked outer membrane protein [Gemmatimonadetes bacterium]|nr:SusC/RagA family TonB-linked outer membrane protein [Gemmatimonadota bacterium]